MDVPTCKRNLFSWISQAIDELNTDAAGIAHCWESTELLRARDRSVQVEAMMKKEELFPNLVPTPAPDPVAASLGDPFTHVAGGGEEEEWTSCGWIGRPSRWRRLSMSSQRCGAARSDFFYDVCFYVVCGTACRTHFKVWTQLFAPSCDTPAPPVCSGRTKYYSSVS